MNTMCNKGVIKDFPSPKNKIASSFVKETFVKELEPVLSLVMFSNKFCSGKPWKQDKQSKKLKIFLIGKSMTYNIYFFQYVHILSANVFVF